LLFLKDAPPPLPEVPEHATYILVGAGTASFAAYRAIRKADSNAKVHVLCIILKFVYPIMFNDRNVLANVMELW